MKKIIIVDGNAEDESKVSNALGPDYDVSTASYFDINNMALSTVITIANIIDAKDPYAGGHGLRVAVISRDIARNLGWDEDRCQNIYFIALLHDVGMMAVPDSILNKPGRLDDNEYEIVKRHAQNGAEMLRDIKGLDDLCEGILCHHERWDGKGYPRGLCGEDIPAVSRVIMVANAYDAMNSDRIYRPRLTKEKIISEFERCKGTQFDPEIAEVFVFMLKEGYSIDPDIAQTKEARARAASDGGLVSVFSKDIDDAGTERDVISGLFTRSYLNTRVGKKLSEEQAGALMLIGIQGFSDIEGKFGKDRSDGFVKEFSQVLQSFFRDADVICHISGGTFAAFVSGQSGKLVIDKKAPLIMNILNDNEKFSEYRDICTVKVGISRCQEDGLTFEELYAAADEKLSASDEVN